MKPARPHRSLDLAALKRDLSERDRPEQGEAEHPDPQPLVGVIPESYRAHTAIVRGREEPTWLTASGWSVLLTIAARRQVGVWRWCNHHGELERIRGLADLNHA